MEYYIVVFSSISLANKVKQSIPPDGSLMSVIHAPKSIAAGGCSYALKFKKEKLYKVKQAIQVMNIPIRGIFQESFVNGTESYSRLS